MTKKEKRFVSILLKIAGDHFDNRRCYDLPEEIINIFTDEEWANLDRKFHQFNEHNETPKENYHVSSNSAWMGYFSYILENEE